MRRAIFLTVVVMLSIPMVAEAHPGRGHGLAAPAIKTCKAERSSDRDAFKAEYAGRRGKHAMRRCVHRQLRAALKTCRAERGADKQAFRQAYPGKGLRAMLRCVRQTLGNTESADDPGSTDKPDATDAPDQTGEPNETDAPGEPDGTGTSQE